MRTSIILLAAGQGTRMQSDLPKVLHQIAGAPLLVHALRATETLATEKTVVVVGTGAEQVAQTAIDHNEEVICVEQAERLGTAHAVDQARPALEGFDGDVIVLYGDTPFISPETLDEIQAARAEGADMVVLGFEARDPTGYGRLILGPDGRLERIVEHRDATEDQRQVRLCNSGVIAAAAPALFDLIAQVGNDNAKGEYYLTDTIRLARSQGLTCAVVTCPEEETLGVNSRADLAAAEATFQAAARRDAMAKGVTLTAPETVFFAFDTEIGRDTTIAPFVTFGPEVIVEDSAEIRSFCHLEGCHIASGAQVGPYARLRPGADLATGARVGNFVEVKAATIGPGAKVNHLSYVGDAEVGEQANIGAGTITCNYDGVFKHRTRIGPRAFIGSNTALVAPVSVGAEAMTGSGAVITRDVPDGDLALARADQINKPGLARRLMTRLRALKKKKGKG